MHRGYPTVRPSDAKLRTKKRDFIKNYLQLWSLLTTYRKSYIHGLFKEPIIGPTAPVLLADCVTTAPQETG